MRRASLVVVAIACADPTRSVSSLDVAPTAIACGAGESVRLSATASAPITFTVGGSAAWISRLDARTASVACEAAGTDSVTVEAAGQRLTVPVVVASPASGTVRVSLIPSTLTLIVGNVGRLNASVDAPSGVATDVRYASSDTRVATVDSLFGIVQSRKSGEATIIAAARADRRVTATATVVVSRGGLLITSITAAPNSLSMRVGDSTRVTAYVQLAPTAPLGTSDAVTFSSLDPSIVTVTADGRVRARSAGLTTIYASPVITPLLRTPIIITVFTPP